MNQALNRLLGITEQALYLHDRAHPLHFALTAQVQGKIQLESLKIALTHLQQRHPLLRVGITLDKNGNPYFVEQSKPIPVRVVSRQSAEHWEQELEAELVQPFTSDDAPLLRMVWLYSVNISELIITCHHAIADGLSVVNLIRDLLTVLGNPHQPLPSLPPPSPCEILLPDCQHQPAYIGQTLAMKVLLGLKKRTDKSSPSRRNYPKLRVGSLSPNLTTALIQRCRAENTTVHGVLCAAFGLAIAASETSKSSFNCFSPVNVRSFLTSAVTENCGLYIFPALSTNSLTPNLTLWELASSIKAQLRSQTTIENLQSKAMEYERLMAANPNPEMVLQLFKKYYGFDLMVTNLGRLNLPQQFGELQLPALYGPAVMMGVENERVLGVTTLGNQIFFTFVYAESLSSTTTPHLPELAIKLIETAINTPSTSVSLTKK
ncbi:MAG TPA: hypothetical protein IGS40_05805 [Trichormus sp. M33_DOE_039]|nr:hypothetical protein [Trichormus sp. M33_DOE_039]